MLRKGLSLAAALAVSGVAVWACSSGSATTPNVEAGASDTSDAAPPDDGASTSQEAAAVGVPISYGQCPAFTKCGGDLVGSWHLTGGCLSDESFAPAKKACPALKESSIVMTATASLTATATNLQRSVDINLSEHLELPKSCIPIPGATCDTVAMALMRPDLFPGGFAFKTAKCVENPTEKTLCECEVATEYAESTDSSYTSTPDGTLTTPPETGTSSPRTFEFCIASSVLTLTETSQSQPLRFYPTLEKN
jgi:hypothetical protein